MVRIDDKNPVDKYALEGGLGYHPDCECGKPATIWIRASPQDLFFCDVCAFHLARILMEDIGHPAEIVQKS
jgi:hypothetical protein